MDTPQNTLFTDDKLIYSAYARCPCGAGLAYPKDPTVRQCRAWNPDTPFLHWDHWDCSDILTGRAVPKGQERAKTHTGQLPFAFYEIKSENQPSANGANTRVKVEFDTTVNP
jgi:hypothetical protein